MQVKMFSRTPPHRIPSGYGAALALAALFTLGCGESQPSATVEINIGDLPTSAGVDDRGQWQSSDWNRDWLAYPAEATLRIEHGLGRTPRAVLVYMSFSPDGFGGALAAGDIARVQSVDEQYVTIQNATQEALFVRVAIP